MRIAINADALAEPHSGVGRYLTQLVTSLGLVDGVNDYLLLHSRPISHRPATPSTFSWEEVSVRGTSDAVRQVHWEQRVFPDVARRRDARMLFVPYFAPPLMASVPVVATIHDVISFALPEYRPLSAVRLYQQVIARAARRATMIITGSEHAKSEIIRYLEIPPQRISVIAEAPAPSLRVVTEAQQIQAFREKYRLGDRYLFYLGGFDSRKNLPLLIAAFATVIHRVNDPTVKLLLSGDTSLLGSSPLYPDWRPLAQKFGLEGRVVSAYIPDEEVAVAHSGALAFVFPSLYEGFARPPLEAMACGAPVVISDQPALHEIVGDAALEFSLAQGAVAATRSLADQLTRIVTTPELRADLRLRSLARARQFTWAQTAAETSAIFSEVIGTSH